MIGVKTILKYSVRSRNERVISKELSSLNYSFFYGEFGDDEICKELESLIELGIIDMCVVQPAVILEPLKGRIITKPSSGEYLHYVQYQKLLWKKLQRHRQFELIGRPVDTEDIHYLCNNLQDDDVFVSGDYDGATDNLSSELSELIIRFLFSRLRKEWVDNLIKSFCHVRVDYTHIPISQFDTPWPLADSLFESCSMGVVEQRNGQLMGHNLSFIVLCLANYLSFKFSFWSSFNDEIVPNVLINGDDILFKTRKQNVSRWIDCVKSVGFEPSVGKNLVLRDVCQINSDLFKIDFDTFSNPIHGGFIRFIRRVTKIDFVNFGILTGRGKGKTDEMRRLSQPQVVKENTDLQNILPGYWSDQRRNMNLTQISVDKDFLREAYIQNRPVLAAIWREQMWDLPESVFKNSISLNSDVKNIEYEDVTSLGVTRGAPQKKLTLLKSLNQFKESISRTIVPKDGSMRKILVPKSIAQFPHGLIEIPEGIFGTLGNLEEIKHCFLTEGSISGCYADRSEELEGSGEFYYDEELDDIIDIDPVSW